MGDVIPDKAMWSLDNFDPLFVTSIDLPQSMCCGFLYHSPTKAFNSRNSAASVCHKILAEIDLLAISWHGCRRQIMYKQLHAERTFRIYMKSHTDMLFNSSPPWTKWPPILQMIFSEAFSWTRGFEFWLKVHWSLFLRVLLWDTQTSCWQFHTSSETFLLLWSWNRTGHYKSGHNWMRTDNEEDNLINIIHIYFPLDASIYMKALKMV